MAEGILRALLAKKHIPNVIAASAGIMASDEREAEPFAISISRLNGVDISHHRAVMLTRAMLENADLVLTMEKMQFLYVRGMIPQEKDKVYLLKAFGRKGVEEDVEDPISRDVEAYEDCFATLKLEISRILPLILKRASESEDS